MNVLMILPIFALGGAERQTLNLAKGLTERKINSSIFVFYEEGNQIGETHPEVKIHFSGIPHTIPTLFKTLFKTFCLIRFLRKNPTDLIYTRLNHPSIVIASKFLRIPLVAAYVNPPKGSSVRSTTLGHVLSVLRPELSVKLTTKVVANSYGLAEECKRYFNLRAKPITVHNGTDIKYVKEKSTETVDHPWLVNKTAPLVVSVGRLRKHKGFKHLISAFAILKDKKVNVRLLIIGGGKEKNSLNEQIKKSGLEDTVSLAGSQLNPYPFILASDLYAQSSIYEGLANTLIEAATLGKPIVSTNHPFGADEIIDHEQTGLLVPVGDEKAMASAIEQILKDDEMRNKMSKNAEKKAQNFTLEKMVSTYEKLFQEVVKSSTR